ncbi:hypothetical protein [Streptomyces sp. URMC 123]|uniref:hypothetical protein n=1 Tax=Streptomyces sp. URMC 123 TaxID=3423403 RepID=UPI003F1D3F67
MGVWLGPTGNVAAHARSVGKDVIFDAPLQLRAKGALLMWPLAGLGVHLVLTALFGPRDEEHGERVEDAEDGPAGQEAEADGRPGPEHGRPSGG